MLSLIEKACALDIFNSENFQQLKISKEAKYTTCSEGVPTLVYNSIKVPKNVV